MADSVRVDTEVVRSAARQADAAGATAMSGSAQVQPSASDVVSVGASIRFTAQVTLARKYTVMANATAGQFGVKLDASAGAYEDQEAQSAETLGTGGAGAVVPAGRTLPAGQVVPADLVSGGVGTSLPAGEVPASPRDIARLIETGRAGAGKKTWQAMESSLRAEAKQLSDAADQLGAAIGMTGDGWQSTSADAATTRMRALQTWYQGHARYMDGLAEQAKVHVQHFSKALTDVPPYRHVLDAERELKAALQSNARAGGAHRLAVVNAQVKVSRLYQASTAGFSTYTFSEAAPQPKVPTPPPGPSPDVAPAAPPVGSGEGPVAQREAEHSPKGAPLDPVQGGPGVGQDLTSGPTWPPGAADPAGPAIPLADVLAEAGVSLPSDVIPGIIGGVVGGLGGVLGGLAGAGQKALQGMEQAAGPMMSGLGQHPPGGEPQQHGGERSPQSPEPPWAGDLSAPGDLGAGGGGADTGPASGQVPLAASTEVAAAPAAAAPVSAPSVPVASEAPALGMGAMGPMMMPPMRGGGGEGSGADNKRLYQERKLKVVAPANSEPVKNRREGRAKPDDRKKP
ncbi:PPE domain-containing protein [Mycobacterium intracellulare]|uniref:PPE domain-containing protein n=1 Tax=Mycobacterium intracellulare TaxID=1767 RepID=UPI001E346ACC|nr:PPE domain-containing protein [Mycobacterium intracellulare]UGT99240.1 PPE domain-containing protein [Mycobacterium intracellulare]